MKNRFIEVTSAGKTFMLNQEEIIQVEPIVGADEVLLQVNFAGTMQGFKVDGTYEVFRAILGTDIVDTSGT